MRFNEEQLTWMKSSRRSGKSSFTWVISTIILEGSTPPSEDLRDAGVRDKPNSTLKSFNPTLTYSTRVVSLKNKNNHEKKPFPTGYTN